MDRNAKFLYISELPLVMLFYLLFLFPKIIGADVTMTLAHYTTPVLHIGDFWCLCPTEFPLSNTAQYSCGLVPMPDRVSLIQVLPNTPLGHLPNHSPKASPTQIRTIIPFHHFSFPHTPPLLGEIFPYTAWDTPTIFRIF